MKSCEDFAMGDFEENFECVHNKTGGVGYEEKVIFVSFSLCGLLTLTLAKNEKNLNEA